MTPTNHEATINFGQAKTNLLINIYNWRVSFPSETVYHALANITACFHFLRISANIAGTFGYLTKRKYFVSTSHIFGSITSAISWEAFRRAIQNMITILSWQTNLTKKHKDLLDILRWVKESTCPNPV
jgi:hypothetical protein